MRIKGGIDGVARHSSFGYILPAASMIAASRDR
jgi:hypothetical protein